MNVNVENLNQECYITESYMFGDSDIDVETGKNAGCKDSFIIKNNLYDLVKNCVNKII